MSIKYQNIDGSFLPETLQPGLNSQENILSIEYTPHKSTRYINVKKYDKEIKKLPELYIDRKNCCGCGFCYSVCPLSAIIMLPDEEGFMFPVVDASLCIRCYKCITGCVFKVKQKDKHFNG